MAKAITHIQRKTLSEEEKRKKDLMEVEDALIDNKEAILESLKVMRNMHDRGVLSLLSGLFGQGDKVLDILVRAADKPETSNTLKNLLLMGGTLGMINVKQLEPFLLKIDSGIARVAEAGDTQEKTSFFDLARSLKDPEVNRAVTLLLTFLKGMGQETKELERNTQLPQEQIEEQRKQEE
ncbi:MULTISPECIES: DUF1641 domain-containing protein [Bacillus]|uniref:DUF1641 domain-containing protein n=2 Tax=Bacillus infantis TaxID=324767 RepID=U5LHP0_9BACI|nr:MULTISPECIES: DUF1641 domain-containing protein [Bacillus]OXT16999.1 hypothetical protein B9K06_13555 [Bacillus sp. OG2]AGX06117.1 hypothetical protein N288_21360 [Bacillus infantis NRRL B-14911]EAR65642.1 YjgD [Bacillus sp. NRRL B-14911]MCA1033844.1 DUF1641 domain-containing protein [Bacillus infantis]MCK6207833.1 DUF1641 domain-containing protein [Bacillus infantis]